MGRTLFDETTYSDRSASELSDTPITRSSRRVQSPNIASQRKAIRETSRRQGKGGDDASMDLGLTSRSSRRRGNSRRHRRHRDKSLSSSDEWSSSGSSELRSSLSSDSSRPRISSARHSRHHNEGVLLSQSPHRQQPISPHHTERKISSGTEESGFMSLLSKGESSLLPIYIPPERINEEVYFPSRTSVVQSELNLIPPFIPAEPEVYLTEPIQRTPTPPPPIILAARELSSISEPPPPRPPPEEHVDIPLWLTQAASDEMMETDCLKPLLREDGLRVSSCTTLLKSNRYLLDTFPAVLQLSRQEPILRIRNTNSEKLRLLMPDPSGEPICQTLALGSNGNPLGQFNGYEFPVDDSDDGLKTVEPRLSNHPGVLGHFRNMRVPCWFEMIDDKDSINLQKALIIIRRSLNTFIKNESERQNLNHWIRPPCLPPPSILNGPKKNILLPRLRPDHFEVENLTGILLDDSCRRLVTSRSVGNFWKTEVKSWCTFYSFKRGGDQTTTQASYHPANGPCVGGKWKRVHLRIWIHPYTGDMMITDKDGAVLGPIPDFSSYSPFTSTFKDTSSEVPTDIAVTNKGSHLTYITFYGSKLNVQEDRLWLAFESLDRLKDFQQAVATVVYLKNRHRYLTDTQIKERTDLQLFH